MVSAKRVKELVLVVLGLVVTASQLASLPAVTTTTWLVEPNVDSKTSTEKANTVTAMALEKAASMQYDALELKEAAQKRWKSSKQLSDCPLPAYSNDWKAPVTYRLGQAIVIYSYGKCGSTALVHYLEQQNLRVIHTHKLTAGQRERLANKKIVWILSLTRNPFIRDMSALVENVDRYNITRTTPFGDVLQHQRQGKISRSWFTDTLRASLPAVDIARHAPDFDWHRRCLFFQTVDTEGREHRVLVLRFEDIPYWPQILAKFFSGTTSSPWRNNHGMANTRVKETGWREELYDKLLALTPLDEAEIAANRGGETALFYSDCEWDAMERDARQPLGQ